jgi:peroxiredoxin
MRNDHLTPRESPIEAGQIAPDFTLLDQDREPWRLADAVREGDVILAFYPLAFTGVCTEEMTCVTNELEQTARLGARVVGISCDSFAAQKAWAEMKGFRQPLLADMHRQVCKAYGLYWPELNVASRGTVVIGHSPDGRATITWVDAREPGKAVDYPTVLSKIAPRA